MTLNWTEDEYAALLKRRQATVAPKGVPRDGAWKAGVFNPGECGRQKAPRQSYTPGRMNKTEAAYAEYLTGLGMVWKFEAVKLRLADRTWYTPDFMVKRGALELPEIAFHEVKGFWRDDARVKFKVAREQFPMFRFIAVRKTKQGWEEIR